MSEECEYRIVPGICRAKKHHARIRELEAHVAELEKDCFKHMGLVRWRHPLAWEYLQRAEKAEAEVERLRAEVEGA